MVLALTFGFTLLTTEIAIGRKTGQSPLTAYEQMHKGWGGIGVLADVYKRQDLKCGDVMLHSLWARRHGTKYNGAPYIVQKAGAAVYTEAGKAQIKEQIAYYQKNRCV